MKNTLDKKDWLTAEKCLAKGWFALREPPSSPNEAELFRMEQGQEIGSLARLLYPTGVLILRRDGKTVYDVTQELMADAGIDTFFEAAFSAEPFISKADIIRRDGGAWHVLEVKSSFSDSRDLDRHIDDLAYTVMVIRRMGSQVNKASLVFLSRNYRFGDGVDSLFEVLDKTDEVNARGIEFNANADAISQGLFADVSPAATLSSACRECDFFESKCLGSGVEHTVFEIPGLHYKKLERLSAAGIVDLSQIPADLGLNPNSLWCKSGYVGKNL